MHMDKDKAPPKLIEAIRERAQLNTEVIENGMAEIATIEKQLKALQQSITEVSIALSTAFTKNARMAEDALFLSIVTNEPKSTEENQQ